MAAEFEIQPSRRLEALTPYAFKAIDDQAAALRDAGVRPIDFGVGDPSEPPPDFVIDALTPAGYKHARSGYPSYIGNAEFRAAAAAYMQRRFGVQLDPETEICSNIGSKEAIFNFPEAFINPGDLVIIPSPAYPPMKTGTLFAKGVPYFAPLTPENDFLIDFAAIPTDIARRAKLMWLNYPNSPTGAVADRAYYKRLTEWARANAIILAADEGCYIDIYFDADDKPPSVLEAAREGVIAFYSLSKRNNMTGYRIGFVAGDRALIEVFKRLKTNIDSGAPHFAQAAAVAALNDDDHAAQMRALYRQKGDILLDAFAKLGLDCARPRATFYIWQRAPVGVGDVEFAQRLLDPAVGIVATPGSLLSDECEVGAGGAKRTINPGAGYLRFALMPTIDETRAAAARLLNNKQKLLAPAR